MQCKQQAILHLSPHVRSAFLFAHNGSVRQVPDVLSGKTHYKLQPQHQPTCPVSTQYNLQPSETALWYWQTGSAVMPYGICAPVHRRTIYSGSGSIPLPSGPPPSITRRTWIVGKHRASRKQFPAVCGSANPVSGSAIPCLR